jgi:hypothetical protein
VAVTRTSPGGFTYRVQKVTGGEYHIWPNGMRTFVATPTAPARPPAAAAAQKAAAAQAAAAQNFQPTAQDTQQAYSGSATFAPDATFYSDQAQRLFKKNQALQQNERQGVENQLGLTTAVETVRRNQPLQEHQATAGANAQGLFYSTTLGNQLGIIRASAVQQEGSANARFAEAERARLAARQAIEAGYGLDDASAMAAAADRQIQRDTTAADAGYLVPDTPLSNPVKTSVAANATKPKPIKSLKPSARPATVRLSSGRVVQRATVNRVKSRWLAAARKAR